MSLIADGAIKDSHPDYETTVAKINEFRLWQKSAGVKVRKTKNTAAVRTLFSIKKTGEDTNKRVADMEPKIEDLHADMQHRHTKQLKLEEAKREVVQAKAKAKAEEREAFEKKVEAGECTPLEQIEYDIKVLQAKTRKIKDDRKIEKAREKAERAAARAAPSPLATAEEQPKRAEEASATEPAPKRRRKDPKATAAPKEAHDMYSVRE